VNSKNKFNVPMGDYKNPDIIQEETLKKASTLLKNADLKIRPFEKLIDLAKKGDFIYFDPPYFPIVKGKSFTTYTKDIFLEDEQKKLADVFNKLSERGCLCMLSNSDTEFIRKLYSKFKINVVRAKRMINSNPEGRGEINELVVTNY
jgi:DNA adenine methylase